MASKPTTDFSGAARTLNAETPGAFEEQASSSKNGSGAVTLSLPVISGAAPLDKVYRTGDGIYCRGDEAGADVETGIDIDANGYPPKVLVVAVEYYLIGTDGTEISQVRYGNGSSWQTLTKQDSIYGAYNNAQVAQIWTLDNPDIDYDRLEITADTALDEGASVTWAAYSGVNYSSMQFETVVGLGNTTASHTFTGGRNGDKIYISGSAYYTGALDLDNQGQVIIEQETATPCVLIDFGHADKDWTHNGTAELYAYYPYFAAALLPHSPVANGGVTLNQFTPSGSGHITKTANGSITLNQVTLSGSARAVRGSYGSVSLNTFTVNGVGSLPTYSHAESDVNLNTFVVSGAGRVEKHSSGDITTPKFTISGVAFVGRGSSGSVTLPQYEVAGEGVSVRRAIGALTLSNLAISGTVFRTHHAVGDIAIPRYVVVGGISQSLVIESSARAARNSNLLMTLYRWRND